MIQYTGKTVQDLYEEINTQIRLFRLGNNYDYGTFLLYLNRAIKEIYTVFMPYEDWNTTDTINISNNSVIPRNFSKMVKVMVSEDGVNDLREAVYVAPVEYTNLTDWYFKQKWNGGNKANPVYTLWATANATSGASEFKIKLFPNTENISGTPPTGYFYPTVNVIGEATFLSLPAELTGLYDTIPVPYLYQDLLLLLVFLKICNKLADADVFTSIYQEMIKERSNVLIKRNDLVKVQKRKLDDFLEPVIPHVPKKPQPNELEHLQ